jgi:hypothetical protein
MKMEDLWGYRIVRSLSLMICVPPDSGLNRRELPTENHIDQRIVQHIMGVSFTTRPITQRLNFRVAGTISCKSFPIAPRVVLG